MKKIWTLYIIETVNGKLYTGITTDLERRFNEHKDGIGAKFLKSNKPKKIVYSEELENRSLATKRELQIKKLSRIQKIKLINNHIEDSLDL